MAGFIRRFLTDPGLDVLLEIESVNILDLEPPASISGIGAGTVLLVSEFEDGPFNVPIEVTSVTDLVQAWDGNPANAGFGSFGFVYASLAYQNPCARQHAGEFWNGNGFLALHGKKFKRLLVCRADTRVGVVEFTRLASLSGNNKQTWDLTPAQTLAFEVDGVAAPVATFTAAAGTVTGAAAAFAAILAGDQTRIKDGNDDAIDITFLAADTTIAAVIARINGFFGYVIATNTAGQLTLTSRYQGTDADIVLTEVTAGVLAKLGHVAGTSGGTGNVANIDAVTLAEADTIVNAATGGDVRIDRDADGNIRATNRQTLDGTGRLELLAASTADDFGFTEGVEDDADLATNTGGTIPAGTRVTNGVTTWVTMQTVTVPDGSEPGPFSVPVRPALDDGTALGAIAGAVVTLSDAVFAAFSVSNPLALTVALTEVQLDAVYLTALNATLDLNSVARESNIIYAARQSDNLRRYLRDNALDASSIGMFGRVACIRPPMGTAKATAQGDAGVGVGVTRNQRAFYCYPQWASFVPQIAFLGATAGGDGFTDDGVIDLGADGFLASVMSQLSPEENPGQLTSSLGAVVGLESGAPLLTIVDYTNFRANGICAPRMDEGSPVYQSGVTSVDPAVSSNLRNIARRRMADFIQDSLARRTKSFSKKLNTTARRNAIVGEYNAFLSGLLSPNNTAAQRIDGYVIDQKSGNTPATLAAGMFRVIVRVRTLSSLDSIVIQTEIGESVDVSELAA
jgi:hypothetical protein